MYKNNLFIGAICFFTSSMSAQIALASAKEEYPDSLTGLNLEGEYEASYFSSLCVAYRELPFCPGNTGKTAAQLEQSTWWDYNGQVFRGTGNSAIARRRVKFFHYHKYGSHWRGRGNRHDGHSRHRRER
jgi:hypothetical protein